MNLVRTMMLSCIGFSIAANSQPCQPPQIQPNASITITVRVGTIFTLELAHPEIPHTTSTIRAEYNRPITCLSTQYEPLRKDGRWDVGGTCIYTFRADNPGKITLVFCFNQFCSQHGFHPITSVQYQINVINN